MSGLGSCEPPVLVGWFYIECHHRNTSVGKSASVGGKKYASIIIYVVISIFYNIYRDTDWSIMLTS